MWIPPERMRLKPALVLVDDQNLIDTMLNRERSPRGQKRGSDIYDAHRDLWALEVFVHPEVRLNDDARDGLLGAIAEQLHIKEWDDHSAPVRPDEIARRRAGEQLGLTRRQETELKELVPSFYDGSIGLAEKPTLTEMVDEYKLAWNGAHDPGGLEQLAVDIVSTERAPRIGEAEPPVDRPARGRDRQQKLT
jgi:hypothetical protein